jgi:acetyl-CoA acetyltransferase
VPTRNPIKDQVAIVGVGTTPFARVLPGRSVGSLALEAAVAAVADAGLGPGDLDGICTSLRPADGHPTPDPVFIQESLGIPEVTWDATVMVPVSFLLADTAHALFSGACTTALIVHPVYRVAPRGGDALRARMVPPRPAFGPPLPGADGYAAFAARYLHDYRASREDLGLIALNNRQHARRNDHAVLRDPMTMADYLSARMVRWPLGLFDIDVAIDGADAFVVTTAERAKDLARRPVLLHAFGTGRTEHPTAQNLESLERSGQQVAAAVLDAKSDLSPTDADILFAYDGFTIIALNWIENLGFCPKGEAGDFLRQHWDHAAGGVLLEGRVPLNTHGGNLSEGGTQGSGDLREAVSQLRGECGDRQVPGGPRAALLATGGLYMNASAYFLRVE